LVKLQCTPRCNLFFLRLFWSGGAADSSSTLFDAILQLFDGDHVASSLGRTTDCLFAAIFKFFGFVVHLVGFRSDTCILSSIVFFCLVHKIFFQTASSRAVVDAPHHQPASRTHLIAAIGVDDARAPALSAGQRWWAQAHHGILTLDVQGCGLELREQGCRWGVRYGFKRRAARRARRLALHPPLQTLGVERSGADPGAPRGVPRNGFQADGATSIIHQPSFFSPWSEI
jgi:hypothetical protein